MLDHPATWMSAAPRWNTIRYAAGICFIHTWLCNTHVSHVIWRFERTQSRPIQFDKRSGARKPCPAARACVNVCGLWYKLIIKLNKIQITFHYFVAGIFWSILTFSGTTADRASKRSKSSVWRPANRNAAAPRDSHINGEWWSSTHPTYVIK